MYYLFFQVFGHQGMRVIQIFNDLSYQPRQAIRRRVSSLALVSIAKQRVSWAAQVFNSYKQQGSTHLGHILVFSFLEFSCPRCSFTITALSPGCSPLFSSSLMIGLLPEDLFFARQRFSLNFGKFSIVHSFHCCTCYCSLDSIGLACLERKLIYRCSDLGFLSFFAHSYCLFREEMDVLMSKFGAFRSPRLLLCRHCIYVSYLLFR